MGLVLGDSLLRNDKQLEDILNRKVTTDTIQDITATKRLITTSGNSYLKLKRDGYDGDYLLNIESLTTKPNHINIRVLDGISFINGTSGNNGFTLDGTGLYPTLSASYDLGKSSNKLKNIYLSGDVNINGTNLLSKINTIESRTINNKPLTDNIILNASDVGALPTSTSYVSSINGDSGAITNVAKLSDIPTDYVNLAGSQTVSGLKNFSNGFKINGRDITSVRKDTTLTSLVTTWDGEEAANKQLITRGTISYWTGAYQSNGVSNLTYCKLGAFGDMATKTASNYVAKSGTETISGAKTFTGGVNINGWNFVQDANGDLIISSAEE